MDGLGGFVGWIVDRVVHWPFLTTLVALISFVVCGWAYLQLEPRYRLADQVPDREQALGATGRIDEKLTGANPVHIMIEWKTGRALYSRRGPWRSSPRRTRSWRSRRASATCGRSKACAAGSRRPATTASRRCRSS